MSTAHDVSTTPVTRTHALLASGVPLSLLLDLVDPRGPRSAELYDAEQPDGTWLHEPR